MKHCTEPYVFEGDYAKLLQWAEKHKEYNSFDVWYSPSETRVIEQVETRLKGDRTRYMWAVSKGRADKACSIAHTNKFNFICVE